MTGARDALSGSGKMFFLVAALFLAAGFLRLNDLTLYTPDSARYVIWGNSLASGNGFLDDTQPEAHSFVFHAPLYPVLIAPVELFFPLAVEPVKIVTLLWGAGALWLLYLWLFRLLGRGAALAGTAMMAFHPLFLVYATEPLSEVPFIGFVLVVLTLLSGIEKGETPGRTAWWMLVLASACLGLVREVGILLWLVVVAYLFGKEWKRGAVVLAAGVLALGGWYYVRNTLLVGVPAGSPGGNAGLVMTHLLTDQEGPFSAELVARLSLNLSSYLPIAGGMLFFPLSGGDTAGLLPAGYGFPAAIRPVVIALFSAAIVAGMVRSVMAGRGGRMLVLSWFSLLLAAAVYPVYDPRFMVPLLPISLYFALSGILSGVAATGGGKKFTLPVLLSVCILVIAPNARPIAALIDLNAQYHADPEELTARLTSRAGYPAYYTEPWGILRERLRVLPDSGTILATPSKELALVSGGRKVLELDPGVTQAVFDRLLRVNDVGYLLAPVQWGSHRTYEFLMAESRRFAFDEVTAAGNLHLLKVSPVPFTRQDPRTTGIPAGAGAADHLRAARVLIRQGDAGGALVELESAAALGPGRPEISYQAIVASAMIGDTVRAREEFRKLLAMRQAGSYLFAARYHLYLMDILIAARKLPQGADRVFRMYDIGRRYWEHGYYRTARELLTSEMAGDSSFFVGHLWAFHFNFQTGDTATARIFLRRLDSIDSSSTLVRNFHALMDLRAAIGALTPSPERARLRLRMATIYRDIELPDECSDEAEAALSDDPGYAEALLFLAETYAGEGYPGRAVGFYRRYLGLVPDDTLAAAAADSLAAAAILAR